MKRFKLECQLLGAINHPNIVQYLGTHVDADTGLPVLLMELMDESLTKFLERCPNPVAFHTQVDFSHDITLALVYLHSNGIFHRDLSSNNVLLNRGERKRAKVTDFGMSQLERVNPRISTATMCPGTLAYMPPEALREKPHHTEMVDIFSFGVLVVQILTRKFPEPTERFESLYVTDPKDRGREIEVQALIKEKERRRNHLTIIEDGHPLLVVSLECLNDSHQDRPPAYDLATQLEDLKSLNSYKSSAEATYEAKYRKLEQALLLGGALKEEKGGRERKEGISESKDGFGQKVLASGIETRSNKLEEERRELETKHKEEIEMYKRLIRDKDYIIQEKDRIITAQEDKLTQSKNFSLRWRKEQNAPIHFSEGGHSAVTGKMAYFKKLNGATICQFDTETGIWSTLIEPPVKTKFALTSIHDFFLTTVGGSANSKGKLYTYAGPHTDRKWVEKYPPIGSACLQPSVTCTKSSLIVFSYNETFTRALYGYVLDLMTLQWSSFEPEFTNQYHHSASLFTTNDNKVLYFAGGIDMYGSTKSFYSCPLNKITIPRAWSSKRRLRCYHSTAISFRGQILSFGGSSNHLETSEEDAGVKTIYKYDAMSDQWDECGEMDVLCSNCMVAVVGEDRLVVVGNEPGASDVSTTSVAKLV